MKLRHLLFIGLASAALFAGCKEENTVSGTPSITVTPESLSEFSVTGGANEAQVVTVTSNRDWVATPSDSWIKVEPASGSASSDGQTVTVYVEENTGIARSGSIEFSTGLISATVKLSQAGSSTVSYVELADVREQATSTSGGTLGDNILVKVVVVSDATLKNYALTESMAMVQDETAGVQLDFDGDNTYAIGDELVIDLSGASYSYFNNLLQISADAEKTTRTAQGVSVTPTEITVTELLSGDYESQYVAVKDVQVASSDLSKNLASADSRTSITIEDAEGETFVISHAAGAAESLTGKQVPQGSGTLKGIASVYGNNIQMVLAKVTDTDEMTGERFDSAVPEYPWTLGSSAYTENASNINGESKTVLKLGTSSKSGNATINVPSGTKSFTVYAVSWKGKPSKLTFSGVDGLSPTEITPAANDGATGNAPYADGITVSDSDKYTFTFTTALVSDTQITVTSVARNLLWDFEFVSE